MKDFVTSGEPLVEEVKLTKWFERNPSYIGQFGYVIFCIIGVDPFNEIKQMQSQSNKTFTLNDIIKCPKFKIFAKVGTTKQIPKHRFSTFYSLLNNDNLNGCGTTQAIHDYRLIPGNEDLKCYCIPYIIESLYQEDYEKNFNGNATDLEISLSAFVQYNHGITPINDKKLNTRKSVNSKYYEPLPFKLSCGSRKEITKD